ncbi:hypothetical protein GEV33_014510 [Tenebrio molitor]|uniref:Tc1-like transposase DDE domain-containing protein n=1 Tax=Tenebrio molitor TaxID=7067 RepID=A0A8J6LCM3_TENMO|nr:hypothetical protein GEV33_014510 [Tenebrio molitor]
MDWPAKSPDMNTIEHVWDMLGKRVKARIPPPQTTQALQTMLLEEWDNLPQELIDNNIRSMPRWCDGAPGHFPRPPTPIPPHIHRHTQHLYTHGRLFPTGLEPVLTSRWWSKECRSSFHHPTVSP